MTSENFRRIALGFPETIESAHMDHPDFRVRGKIFATISPDPAWGVVMLTPEGQEEFLRSDPEAFVPVNGAWGRKGATKVLLKKVKSAALKGAMAAAWCNKAPKTLAEEYERK